MAKDIEKLKRLAGFESLFHRDNLLLGLRMWLRVNLAMLVVGIVLGLTGVLTALGVLGLSALVMVSFFLYQWSASLESRKNYDFEPSPWCWWSIVWRLIVFMLPVFFILVLVAGPPSPGPGGEFTEKELEQLSNMQLITAFLSIVPMGLATSQALMASLRRKGINSGPGDDNRGGD